MTLLHELLDGKSGELAVEEGMYLACSHMVLCMSLCTGLPFTCPPGREVGGKQHFPDLCSDQTALCSLQGMTCKLAHGAHGRQFKVLSFLLHAMSVC